MADSVITKARKGLVYQLRQINGGSDYNYDFKEVIDWFVPDSDRRNRPSAMIMPSATEYSEPSNSTQSSYIDYIIDILIPPCSTKQLPTLQENIIADVHKRLYNNYELKTDTLSRTAKDIQLIRSEPYGLDRQTPQGVEITVRVFMNQDLKDPSLFA